GLENQTLIVTIRPPANEAHYRSPESDLLFRTVMDFLGGRWDIKMVLLPRNQRQEESIRDSWPGLLATGQVIIPAKAVGGLNLIWHSDLVISGGGTMNREAAALGVPVYSIFRGKIGAVDHYLAKSGRLVLVESVEEVRTKIRLEPRQPSGQSNGRNNEALR